MNRNNNPQNSDSNSFFNAGAKRQRVKELNFPAVKPSFVLHCRNLVDGIEQQRIYETLEKYGEINDIMMLPKKRQALVEFDQIECAMAGVQDSTGNGIFIDGLQCYLNYSTSQKIIKPGEQRNNESQSNLDDVQNRVLNVNVIDPLYPITINVMHSICESFGKVLRISIIRKNGVQVMIEFDTAETSAKAKEELDGADIYSGCCTLRIDFAEINRLNIHKNDADGFDFTLNDSIREGRPNNNYANSSNKKDNLSSLMSLTESNFQSGNDNNNSSLNKPIASLGGQIVLSAHNLHPDHFNCDRLFNLLSLYGNVDKCKFLLSKEGSAMLQMSNAKALFDNTVHLNNVNIFGRKIQVHVGKQTVLQPVNNPVNLKDDTCSYKEYMQNRNNRYQSAEAAQKNKPLPPSNVLYWYNAPPGITEEQIMDVFVSAGAILPTKVKIFPKKADKSSTGLVEFDNTSDCVESLIYANHKEITHTSSKFPYIFKMCFSSTPISRDMNSNNKRHNYDTIHNYDNDPNEND